MLKLMESAFQCIIYMMVKEKLPADISIENCGGDDDEEQIFIGLHADERLGI
jgi:hypothetical protein